MSRVEEALKVFQVELDAAWKRQRQSDDPLDASEALDVIERMTLECVRGLLEDLGEGSRPGESPYAAVARASAALGEHKEQLVTGAPVRFLEKKVAGLDRILRDVGYLRETFGQEGERPKPADLKWDHATAAASYVLGTMTHLAENLKPAGARVHRLTPEVDIDFPSVRQRIMELLAQDLGVCEFVDAVIAVGARHAQVPGWGSFRDLPYEDELGRKSSFFETVIAREPPKAPLAGFYAQIAYPSRDGETVADLALMGADSYHPDSEDWFDVVNYWPRDALAGSSVLASIYRLAYAPGGLGNAADYTLCLAWGAYLTRACARRYATDSGVDFVGARVGFSGGDWIELGWVRPITS